MSGRIEEDEDDSVYFPEELEVFYENKCTKLGSGSFAKVLLAEHKGTKEMVAIKVMNKGRMKKKNSLHRFRSEVEALKTLIHQHICQLYQVYENEHIVSLVMEYCPGGELFDYIVSKKKLPENEARTLFRQMVAAVAFTHENGYAHRDIKPENMLLNNEKSIKMIDFGLSVKPASGLTVPLVTRVGSPAYAAPELVSGDLYFGDQTDIWSLGVVLYAVLCGSLPFDDETTAQLYEQIKKGEYYQPKHLSKGSAKLLRRMLEVDPRKRIAMNDLLEDEWLRNGTELPVVKSESAFAVSSINEDAAEEVADALQMNLDKVKSTIEQKEYNHIMAYYLLLMKKKEKDVRKFQLIYQLSNKDLEMLHLSGTANSNLRLRQRSQTERKDLTRMIDEMESDDDDLMDMDTFKRKGGGKLGHLSLPRRKTSSQEAQSMKPFLPISEQLPLQMTQELREHQSESVNGRAPTENKTRSGSKLNELMSAVFKLDEKPRKFKGFYHMGNTSTKTAEEIRKEITRVLEELASYSLIQSISNPKRYLFKCKAIDKTDRKMAFELEVCAIPKVDSVVGIRNKRLNGDIWFYKRLLEQVFSMLKL